MVGILEKLGLKKKKDDPFADLDADLGLGDMDKGTPGGEDLGADLGMPPDQAGLQQPDTGLPGMEDPMQQQPMSQPEQPMGGPTAQPAMQPMQQQPMQQQPVGPEPVQPAGRDRDMEIVQSKLDAIRATLQSMDQRLANLEHAAYPQRQQQQQQYRW